MEHEIAGQAVKAAMDGALVGTADRKKEPMTGKKALKAMERVMNALFFICGMVAVAFVLLISIYLIISGLPAILEIGPINFLFGTRWYASTGDFGTGHRLTMDAETAKRAIDFVIAKSGHRRNIEVDFFGGEPLMAMDTVKRAVEYARSIEEAHGKCFRFTITTNGVLLDDETIEYINREMSNAVLSLDGRKAVNDDLRPTINGKGSYDVIVPKFRKLIEGRGTKDYYLRGTFTRFHQDFAEDVKALAAIGKNISVEPVVGKETDPYALQEADLPALKAEYERLAEYLRDHPETNFFHFNVDLAQGPCVIKRLRGCGAGCEYVAITPEGDIYPCHQFVGNEEYKLGSLYDGSFDQALSGTFAALNIYTREECRSCWARFYCSGGCSASNLLVNGDIKRPHRVGCELERKRLECAIALKAIAAGMGA